jgi:hypothetical protein
LIRARCSWNICTSMGNKVYCIDRQSGKLRAKRAIVAFAEVIAYLAKRTRLSKWLSFLCRLHCAPFINESRP